MTEERWRQLTFWPLVVASLAFIGLYSWQVIADLHGTAELVTRLAMAGIWVLFLVDYVVRLVLAEQRSVWFRTHIFDLLIVVLPALKPLALLRVVTLVVVLQRTVGSQLRSRLSIYGAGSALVLIWIASLAVLDAERGRPGANIESFGDALWWSFVTIATVGYGDFYPVTAGGRFVAVILMGGGIAVVGVVTATLASWVVERLAAAGARQDEQPATRGQVHDMEEQIGAIVRQLSDEEDR